MFKKLFYLILTGIFILPQIVLADLTLKAGTGITIEKSGVGGNLTISATASNDDNPYGVNWNGNTTAPSKNAMYDKISAVESSIAERESATSTEINANRIADGTISNTEFQYLNGVSSDIQTQLNSKLSSSASGIAATNIADGSVSNTEFQYLDGATSNLQDQISAKQSTYNYTPENQANKSASVALGTSDTLYPTQNAVRQYVVTGLATKQNTIAYTTENAANKQSNTSLGTSNTYYPTQGAVKTYVDTGLALKQNSIAYTTENVANKNTNTSLGTSDTYYPTQNAVKTYADTKLAATALSDTAYDATTWLSDTTHAPTKNAIRNKIESMGSGTASYLFGANNFSGTGAFTTTGTGSFGNIVSTAANGTTGYIDIKENGSNGLQRVRLTVPAAITTNATFTLPVADGSSGQGLLTYGNGTLYFGTVASSSASVAGNDTQIQYNNNGSLGADPLFAYNSTYKTVVLGNSTSGRGGISFGDNNTNTSFKTGYTGADNATENYLLVMPNAKPSAKSIVTYLPNGNVTGGNNATYAKVEGTWWDVATLSNTSAAANSTYYGKNSTGSVGYYALPAGGGNTTYASIAEANTGTETAKAISPDTLAGSNYGARVISFTLPSTTNATAGMVSNPVAIPAICNGMNIISVGASVYTASSSGTPTFDIYRLRNATAVSVTTTNVTIDANEYDSTFAATASVINASNDDVVTGDKIYCNQTVTGTGTQGAGCRVTLQMP